MSGISIQSTEENRTWQRSGKMERHGKKLAHGATSYIARPMLIFYFPIVNRSICSFGTFFYPCPEQKSPGSGKIARVTISSLCTYMQA